MVKLAYMNSERSDQPVHQGSHYCSSKKYPYSCKSLDNLEKTLCLFCTAVIFKLFLIIYANQLFVQFRASSVSVISLC